MGHIAVCMLPGKEPLGSSKSQIMMNRHLPWQDCKLDQIYPQNNLRRAVLAVGQSFDDFAINLLTNVCPFVHFPLPIFLQDALMKTQRDVSCFTIVYIQAFQPDTSGFSNLTLSYVVRNDRSIN